MTKITRQLNEGAFVDFTVTVSIEVLKTIKITSREQLAHFIANQLITPEVLLDSGGIDKIYNQLLEYRK